MIFDLGFALVVIQNPRTAGDLFAKKNDSKKVRSEIKRCPSRKPNKRTKGSMPSQVIDQ